MSGGAPPRPPAPTLAAVFAHPDDEAFSIGGTVRRYADEGVRCHLFCATSGDAGRSSGIPVASREELGALRRDELRTAAHILGFADVQIGGDPDGALGTAVDQDRLIGDVVAFLRRCRPQVVLTFGPDGGSNRHADHRAISRAATAAFFLAGLDTAYVEQLADGGPAPHAPQRLYYYTWALAPDAAPLALHGLPATAAIDVTASRESKRAAFLAHTSQRDLLDRFDSFALVDVEQYALAAGVPQPAACVDDLFAGLA